MAVYIKKLEAYRLGDGEQPQWLKDAIMRNEVIFDRKRMIDAETFKMVENAIVGIRMSTKSYPIDSYIVRDNGHIKIVDAYDFETQGFEKED